MLMKIPYVNHSSADTIKSVLEKELNFAIGWFKQNYIQAKPTASFSLLSLAKAISQVLSFVPSLDNTLV